MHLIFINFRCEVDYWNSDDCITEEVLTKKIKNKHGLFCLLTDTINSKILDNAGNNSSYFLWQLEIVKEYEKIATT